MNPNYRGLAFLLSLGSLPLACTKEGNDTDTDNGTGPNTSTGLNTSTGTTTDDTPTTSAATTSSGTTGPIDTTIDTTGPIDTTTGGIETATQTSVTSTDTGNDTDLPPPTDPTCIAYAAHYVECVPRLARYQTYLAQYCEVYKGYAMNDGQGCVDAFEALYVCLSKADCAAVAENAGTGASCPPELMAVESACPSLGDGGETSTT